MDPQERVKQWQQEQAKECHSLQSNPAQNDSVRLAILKKIADHKAHIDTLMDRIEALEKVLPQFPDPMLAINLQ